MSKLRSSQSSIAYVNIVKELKSKNTEFYIYKLKQEKSFRIVLKNIHVTINLDKIEIEDLGHIVTKIWNIKNQGTKTFHMFYIELKPKSNNKNIYKVSSFLKYRVKFEPPYSKHEISQCVNCQWYDHIKSFCFHTARYVKCIGESSMQGEIQGC